MSSLISHLILLYEKEDHFKQITYLTHICSFYNTLYVSLHYCYLTTEIVNAWIALFACECQTKCTFRYANSWKAWLQLGSVFSFILLNHGWTALFSRQFLPKGSRRHTILLLITLLCQWCSIILIFLAGCAPHGAEKVRQWYWHKQMVSSLWLLLILSFQISVFCLKMLMTSHLQTNAALLPPSTVHAQQLESAW